MRLIIAMLFIFSYAQADIKNPISFIGETVLGSTAGAPLFVGSTNSDLTSGEPQTTYFENTTTITVATSASYANMTTLVSGSVTGTYQVWCRTTVTHTTNNADIFMAIGLAGTFVADSVSQARPFIQGGVTPSLAVPMVLDTFSEVVASSQILSCMWRTSVGTASSVNSRAMIIRRVR